MGLKRDLVSDETARSVETQAVQVAKNLNAEYWSVSGKADTLTQYTPIQIPFQPNSYLISSVFYKLTSKPKFY